MQYHRSAAIGVHTDAFVAYAIGFIASALWLYVFGILTGDASADELVGKISLQALAASMRAIPARSPLGGEKPDEREKTAGGRYAGQLFLMCAGALFFFIQRRADARTDRNHL